MKFWTLLGVFLSGFIFSFVANANEGAAARMAKRAVSSDSAESKAAIAEIRGFGQNGLNLLFAAFSKEIAEFKKKGAAAGKWPAIENALDSAAMQKDSYASRLFWHTDLEAAKKASGLSGKPVLSLRLLGGLNEEFSCANSRLFRAILYSNSEISEYLRENYILHWQSVRPAPKVTIDFGDGRKLVRTITGNSIHYVIDAEENLIDALPGLYSPQDFLNFLKESKVAHKEGSGRKGLAMTSYLANYRSELYNRIVGQRNAALSESDLKLEEPEKPKKPTAIDAAPLAASKMAVTNEISILTAISDDFSKYQPQFDIGFWTKLAMIRAGNTKLDEQSLAFISRQTGDSITSKQLPALIERIERYAALDTARNDFMIRPAIYSLISNAKRRDLNWLNDRIYSDVFLTPRNDEWLGLYSPDVYTGLEGNGLIR